MKFETLDAMDTHHWADVDDDWVTSYMVPTQSRTINYDDSISCTKIIDWWNRKYPENRVTRNPDKYGVDLVGIDNPTFCIEVERSGTWKSHHRPQSWGAPRVPARKAKFWMRTNVNTVYVQTNKELSACITIDDDTLRNGFAGPWSVQLSTGAEPFFYYSKFEYHTLEETIG